MKNIMHVMHYLSICLILLDEATKYYDVLTYWERKGTGTGEHYSTMTGNKLNLIFLEEKKIFSIPIQAAIFRGPSAPSVASPITYSTDSEHQKIFK